MTSITWGTVALQKNLSNLGELPAEEGSNIPAFCSHGPDSDFPGKDGNDVMDIREGLERQREDPLSKQ